MKSAWWHRSLLCSTMLVASAYSASCLANVLPITQQASPIVVQPAPSGEQTSAAQDQAPIVTPPAGAAPIDGPKVAEFATNLLGVKYRYGGDTPETGLDCSGFIVYVFRKMLGVDLPHHAATISTQGQAITLAELRPGDLVFFNTRGRKFSHAGIYVGDNKFIHAPRAGKAVQIAQMDLKYWAKRFNGARRLITQSTTVAALSTHLSPALLRATLHPEMANY